MIIVPASSNQTFGHGPFRVRRLRPGSAFPYAGDHGLYGLGAIDHATLEAGLTVPMHQHVNDEIFSYLRHGAMVHQDSDGNAETIKDTRLMVMNSGRSFWHEESVSSGSVSMLQIFVRPSEDNLEPICQFIDLPSSLSMNHWRLLVAPEGEGGFGWVRQRIWIYDARMDGTSCPQPPRHQGVQLLYFFSGLFEAAEHSLRAGDCIILTESDTTPHILGAGDVVLFDIDTRARFSRSGTISG